MEIENSDSYTEAFEGKFLDKIPQLKGSLVCQNFHTKVFVFTNAGKIKWTSTVNKYPSSKSIVKKNIEKCAAKNRGLVRGSRES